MVILSPLIKLFLQLLMLGITLTGVYVFSDMSYHTLVSSYACPSIGAIPVCFLMTQGFLLMAAGMLLPNQHAANLLFYTGAFVVLLIVAISVVSEVAFESACLLSQSNPEACWIASILTLTLLTLQTFMINQN